ncbi:MAG: glycosyltransferase family 1 protein [Acidobacteriota bacterium]|nr:glycosyltransferase family 1 protein [Acidobacteriota bacterium]
MRVLIDYRSALRNPSGVGLWVSKLVEALAEASGPGTPDVTVFSSSWKDRLSPRLLPTGVTTIDRRVPVRVLNWLWHRYEWPTVEALTQQEFDVVHSPTPLLIPSRRAAKVVTIHDLDFLTHPAHTTREIRRDYPSLARAHAHRAHAVVVPSHYTADRVAKRFGLPRDRITVCPNGRPDWPDRTRPTAGRHLLFVGTIGRRKNVDGLLSAYAALRAARANTPPLVLVGRPDTGANVTLERLQRSPLAGHVNVTGYVDTPRLRALYEEAVMVVMPSLDEGFGIPALEGMTTGVPVVAADRGALPEVVGDAGILVDPSNIAALTDAMRRILDDESLRRRLSIAGRERSARFTWRSSAATLNEAYTRALVSRNRGS